MVIFIISAEETIPIANPRFVNWVGNAVLHYKPIGGIIPSPINSRTSRRGHGCMLCDHSFAGSPAFHDDGETCSSFFRHPDLTRNLGLFIPVIPDSIRNLGLFIPVIRT